MADEIKTQFSLELVNGDHRENIEAQVNFDQAAVGGHKPIVEVGTSEEVLSVGDVSTPGVVYFRNLDDTNYVVIGPEDTGAMVAFLRIQPGKWGFMPLDPGVTIRAQANTAAVKLLMFVAEA